MFTVESSPLGKKSEYITNYDASLLFPIPREIKRNEIGITNAIPFVGFDVWNAYELSWLNPKGKPQVAIARFYIDCLSQNFIESKSFKLYLNSFNNTKIPSLEHLYTILTNDIQSAVKGNVILQLDTLESFANHCITMPEGRLIDAMDIEFDKYEVSPSLLRLKSDTVVNEILCSNLLKSNCLVTGQPDWATIEISYTGCEIDTENLLRYIVSFRDHNEFHEQCIERIYNDIQKFCAPSELTVKAYYTRRGGLDINPVRSSKPIENTIIRTIRQ